MKKMLSLLGIVVIFTSMLVGCGGSTQTSGTTTISYYTWRASDTYPSAMLQAFYKKYPNIKVDVQVSHDVDQYLQGQKVRLVSGDALDVTSVEPASMKDYVNAGYLTDLSGQSFLKNFIPSALSGATINGKVYAIPTAINLIAVWYNKDLFKKLNLTVPSTWDEFLSISQTLKQHGVIPLVEAGKDGWPMEFSIYPFMNKLVVDDPTIFDKVDKGEIKYTDPVFVNTFKQIADFYKTGDLQKDMLSLSGDQATALFAQQKVAMVMQGDWFSNGLVQANPHFAVGVFPMPIPGEGNKVVIPMTVGSYDAIVNSSKHKDAAMKLLQFMASPEGAQFEVDQLGSFSPVEGTSINSSSYLALWKPLLNDEHVDFFYSLQYPGANSAFLKGLQELYLGQITPEQLGANLQAVQDQKSQ
jgi:raffinose/stachyose/melibiose transport system substrate-binding protein